jgi:hypothetical protein
MHQLSRGFMEHLSRGGTNLVDPFFSLTNIIHIGSNLATFHTGVATALKSDFEWYQNATPDPEWGIFARQVVALAYPDAASHKQKLMAIEKALETANGNFGNRCCAHYCRLVDGRPCCDSEEQARRRTVSAVTGMLFQQLPTLGTATRWFTVVQCFGWWFAGLAMHGLFHRGWVDGFAKKSGEAQQYAARQQEHLDAAAAAAAERPAAGPGQHEVNPFEERLYDSWSEKMLKRIGRVTGAMRLGANALHTQQCLSWGGGG